MARRIPLLLLGFLGMAILAELVLRFCPVSTGYGLEAVDAARPMVHGTPHSRYTYSKDWNFQLANSGVLNNRGFRSSYDYFPDARSVAVIGNSFVQADALAPPQTLTERLGVLLHRPAYALGGDGFSLADYLAAAQWASATFGSRTLVVLLTTGDLSHSCTPHLGGHYLQVRAGQARDGGALTLALVDRPPQTALKALVNESALFRYLYANLRAAANWSKGWQRLDAQGDAPSDPAGRAALLGCTDAAYAQAATRFLLTSFQDIVRQGTRIVFVVAPGYRSEQMLAPGALRDVDVFASHAAAAGFRVIRLDEAFAAALRDGERLDFMPIDGHWNGTANALAAMVTAQALSGELAAPRVDQAQ